MDVQNERHQMVVKSNALIQKSRFSLSTQQQKIVLYLISKISPYDDEFKLYDIFIPDFCRICGIDSNNGGNYASIRKMVKDLTDKSVWVTLEDGRETVVRWIERPYIDPGKGVISIKLDELMKPFLLFLKDNFTKYDLLYALHFKSKYTIRLYELFQSVHYHDFEPYTCVFDVEELKMRCDGSTYPEYRDFKRRILEPSIREINQYSEKNVSYREIKQGRKVLAVEFTVQSKPREERWRVEHLVEKELGTAAPTIWEQVQELDRQAGESSSLNQTPPHLYK